MSKPASPAPGAGPPPAEELRAWADRLAPSGGSAYSVHPGWARTPGLRSGLPAFYHLAGPLLRSPQEGAGTAVWLAAGGALGQATGRFFHDRRPRPDARWPVRHPYRSGRQGRPESEQLFQWCAGRTGVRWPGTPGPLSAAAAGAPSPGAGTGSDRDGQSHPRFPSEHAIPGSPASITWTAAPCFER